MNLLTIDNVTKSYTERLLFDHISLGINEGDKIGVIGINGTGKSTLLKIIAGLEEPDHGTLTCGKKVKIEFLPQAPVFDSNKSILDYVVEGKTAEQSYRNLPGEAKAMLSKLGIFDSSITAENLSGGQKKRVALVRTLLTPADILVLDEPTNHLDSEMAEWLQEYLIKLCGAFIMITHDRYFLDKVTNKIIEIDKSILYSYLANYSGFLALKAEREAMTAATDRKMNALYKLDLEWMQRGAKARSTKQKAHIQRFETLRDRKQFEIDSVVEINSVSSRLGKKTMILDHIYKSFGDKTLIKDFSYILLPGDRIGIIGPNGCGKTTLLKIMTNSLEPDSGIVEIGTTVKIGYFTQENETLNLDQKVLEYIKDTAEIIETTDGTITASQMCERFLFDGSMQYTQIAKLSGGEKRRLHLLKILMEAPNILILDEPTNDLDIQTLTILEDYISCFPGIIVTVSHDRYFLDKIAERIFCFEGCGIIKQYEGNFSDYKRNTKSEVLDQAIFSGGKTNGKKSSESIAESKNSWKQSSPKLKFTYIEQKEFESIDDDIAVLETQLQETEQSIIKSATNYSELTALSEKKEQLEAALEKKMERWVYLNDLAEQIKNV